MQPLPSLQQQHGVTTGGAPPIAARRSPVDGAARQGADGGPTAHYGTVYHTNVRPVLDSINQVADLLGLQAGLQFPGIVIFGDQSAAKTSVLEALSGISLPRGQGITTRVPTRLALVHGSQERITVSYRGKHILVPTAEAVAAAVEQAQQELAGVGTGVADQLISVRVEGPHCPDLTLIDLPGIRHVGTDDQPDIARQIRALIDKFAADESKVLLVVVPAHQDFATAEAFSLAEKHDRRRERTLCVVTKIDTCESGIIRAKLEGKCGGKRNLALGFIGVRCRTQKELDEGISNAEARLRERQFIESHPELSQMNPACLGVPALLEKLAQVQLRCLEAGLPRLLGQLGARRRSLLSQLQAMPNIEDEEVAHGKALQCVEQLAERYKALCRGDYMPIRAGEEEVDEATLLMPQLLDLCESFRNEVYQAVNLDQCYTEDCYLLCARNIAQLRGVGLPNIVRNPAFERAYRAVVYHKLQTPADTLVRGLRQLVEGVLQELLGGLLHGWPRLQKQLKMQLHHLLDAKEKRLREHVRLQVRQEFNVFTVDPGVDKHISALRNAYQLLKAGDASVKATLTDQGLREQTLECLARLHAMGAEDHIVEMQLSLAAYGARVVSRNTDGVSCASRQVWASEVAEELFGAVWGGLRAAAKGSFVQLIVDPEYKARRDALNGSLHNVDWAIKQLQGIDLFPRADAAAPVAAASFTPPSPTRLEVTSPTPSTPTLERASRPADSGIAYA